MKKLRRLRVKKGLTMDQLVERTGGKVSKRTISELERGMRNAHTLTLAKLAEALEVDIDDLVEDEAPKGLAPPSEPERAEERRRNRLTRYVFAGWARVLNNLRDRLEKLLDSLPPLPDNEDVLASRTSQIHELIEEFYAIQRDLNESGDPHLVWPYIEAKESREHLPNDLYEAITDYQGALRDLNLNLIPRADKWVHRAEEILAGLRAAKADPSRARDGDTKT